MFARLTRPPCAPAVSTQPKTIGDVHGARTKMDARQPADLIFVSCLGFTNLLWTMSAITEMTPSISTPPICGLSWGSGCRSEGVVCPKFRRQKPAETSLEYQIGTPTSAPVKYWNGTRDGSAAITTGASVRTYRHCERTRRCGKRGVRINTGRQSVPHTCLPYNPDGHNKKARCHCAGPVTNRALSCRMTSYQINSDQDVLSPCGETICATTSVYHTEYQISVMGVTR